MKRPRRTIETDLWPVFEFRPLSDVFRFGCRRYADGKWIDDDGEYDVAFIGDGFCFMFEPPYQRNIICSWLTTHWRGHIAQHPRGNPWHYALRPGTNEWGGDWGRDLHPNRKFGQAGMDKVVSERRAASGIHIEMHASDRHIAAGMLRNRETKEVFRFPESLACMYCGTMPSFACEAA